MMRQPSQLFDDLPDVYQNGTGLRRLYDNYLIPSGVSMVIETSVGYSIIFVQGVTK
jgi:hypothetical protein